MGCVELDRCLCQWVCLDISVKGSACVEVGAQSRLGRVAKEMSLWALKSGSSVLHSQLHFLLIVCCAQEPSLPTAPLPLPLPLAPQPLAPTDLFAVSLVVPFPEHHRVGIKQYVASMGWLLSLRHMRSGSPHVFSWLDGSSLFRAE